MKSIQFILFLFIPLIAACQQGAQNQAGTLPETISKIEVLDFYGTHRCMTCEAIEANAKYTVETFFNDELKSGKVTFQAINVDLKENEPVATKFEAFGTALFLNVISGGNEQHIDLTTFAFSNGLDKKAFSAGLKEKIEEQLEAL